MFACMCLSIACMPDDFRGQKRTPDPLKLEVQKVMRHHVGAGTQTRVLSRSSKCSYPLRVISPSPVRHVAARNKTRHRGSQSIWFYSRHRETCEGQVLDVKDLGSEATNTNFGSPQRRQKELASAQNTRLYNVLHV